MMLYSFSGTMSQQVLLQKEFERIDFLTTTQYEKAVIPKSPRFIIRQGDLIVTNYVLWSRRSVGIGYARLKQIKENMFLFRDSHLIIAEGQKTVLIHNEHGIVEIPEKYYGLRFYTFEQAFD
jgi:hypothetical protein